MRLKILSHLRAIGGKIAVGHLYIYIVGNLDHYTSATPPPLGEPLCARFRSGDIEVCASVECRPPDACQQSVCV